MIFLALATRNVVTLSCEMAAAEDVYTDCNIRHSGWNLIIMPCVFVIPSPLPGLKISLRTTYPPAWVTHYQSGKLFSRSIRLCAENSRQGHLHWDDVLFHEAQAMWDAAQLLRITQRRNPVCDVAEPGAGLYLFS